MLSSRAVMVGGRALVTSLLVALVSCGADPGTDAAPPSVTPAPSGGEPVGPSASPSASATAIIYSNGDLVTALPGTRRQRHGVALLSSCLTMNRACGPNPESGFVSVVGSSSGPSTIDIGVTVTGQYDADAWRRRVSRCPQGRYQQPLKYTPKYGTGAYRPGERGTSTRTAWSVRSWVGFTCAKDLVRLWPDGAESGRDTEFTIALTNGIHALDVTGRSLAEARALAEEYLARLESKTGG